MDNQEPLTKSDEVKEWLANALGQSMHVIISNSPPYLVTDPNFVGSAKFKFKSVVDNDPENVWWFEVIVRGAPVKKPSKGDQGEVSTD